MKSCIAAALLLGLCLAPRASCADVVFDSSRITGENPWWSGGMTYQEVGVVVNLVGKARKLDSLVLHQFMGQNGGKFDVTASIYRVPKAIKDDDTLHEKPLWTVTVHKQVTGTSEWSSSDFVFRGKAVQLPDKVLVTFSFKAQKMNGAITVRLYDPKGEPSFGAAVGTIESTAIYEGHGGPSLGPLESHVGSHATPNASWTVSRPGAKLTYASMTLRAKE